MSFKISEHLYKNNLHHAYLIQGRQDEVMLEILAFLESFGIKTSGNPDFCHISIDNFKIDEAFNLRSFGYEKSFSSGKKIFIISTNHFSLDAQGVLLKILEEPIQNTHFFLIMPDINGLLKTFISRFYFISVKPKNEELKYAEKFIAMPLRERIDFLKELLAESTNGGDEDVEIIKQDSPRSKALKFLNTLEFALHKKLVSKSLFDTSFFAHFFKVREFLRQPGSSIKNLMESVALAMPIF